MLQGGFVELQNLSDLTLMNFRLTATQSLNYAIICHQL